MEYVNAPENQAKPFSAEKLVPLSMIREHTKTDDVETVSDDLLRFYRTAALQAADQYLGISVTSTRWVSETVEQPPFRHSDIQTAIAQRKEPFNTQQSIHSQQRKASSTAVARAFELL